MVRGKKMCLKINLSRRAYETKESTSSGLNDDNHGDQDRNSLMNYVISSTQNPVPLATCFDRLAWFDQRLLTYSDATLELEDKYKRTMDEIEALKDHLAMRKELTRRAQSVSSQVHDRMAKAEQLLQEHMDDQKAINADMTRQYKTMQTEMGLKIHQLETELGKTRTQLEDTKEELKNTQEERDRLVKERDEEINALNVKVNAMEKAYEGVLREALDNLQQKIAEAKLDWENNTTVVHGKAKQVLLELGLNPLYI